VRAKILPVRRVLGVLSLVAALSVGGLADASPVAATPAAPATSTAPAAPGQAAPTFTISGHGYGHGRGLGQFGSLGYALAGFRYDQILGHYYGGTWMANIGLPNITVRLTAADGGETLVTNPRGGIEVAGFGTAGNTAIRIVRTGAGRFTLFNGPGCGGPWTAIRDVAAPSVRVYSVLDPADPANLLQRCDAGYTRSYRGDLLAIDTGSNQVTVNETALESYLRGVVPRESPASWGDMGGGIGIEALKAQAVAARSYALAENRAAYAKTCDTTSCQVYDGAAITPSGGALQVLEDRRSDAAIAGTAGFVRKFLDRDVVARTEFSSSTGGYTAGGVFPAVADEGDAVASNPYHNWSVTMTADQLTAQLGVGSVIGVDVVERNGLGADGGRAVRVVVRTTGGNVSLTGDVVRQRLGLRSNWFSVTAAVATDSGPGPAGGYRLGANGTVAAFGAAPPTSASVASGSARAIVVGGPSRTTGYLLGAGGAIVPFNGAAAMTGGPTWGFDAARDLALRADGRSGYLLDLNGGVWPVGGAPTPSPGVSHYRGEGIATGIVVRADGVSGYVSFADGVIGSFGGAPARPVLPPPAGTTIVDIMLQPDGVTLVVADSGGGLIRSDGVIVRPSGAAGSAVAADERPDGTGYLLAPGGGVTAVLGAPTVAAGATSAVVDLALVPEPAGYVLDYAGGLHPFGGAAAPRLTAYFGGWDIARGVAIGPAGTGVVLDGWGGLHPFGTATSPPPNPTGATGYWQGWDIARSVVLMPGRDDAGYVLDGWGGLHPFGGAPSTRGGPYWSGWDIARAVALLPDGTGGYVLDGWGGVHAFAIGSGAIPPTASGAAYFSGRDVARGLVVLGPGRGFVLESDGEVHGFGGAATSSFLTAQGGAVAIGGGGPSGWGVWVERGGQLHTVNATPSVPPTITWGFGAVRGIALVP
jgi:SpoIID/LytB domain protein